MSFLDTLESPQDTAPIITITGEAGLGKTRLAATFAKPIFIRAEDGMKSIPLADRPKAFPLLKNADELFEQLMMLVKEDHDFETLVIDSVTQLDTLFTNHIVESDPKKPKTITTALGGYGAGFAALSAMHARVRKAAGALNERKNMTIVFIAHSQTIQIDLPDQDAYSRYDLRMHKNSVCHYVDNVDLVGHLKLETFVTGEEKKKAISDGTRVMVAHTMASCVSKNRYGITEEIHVPEGENPLIPFIPFFNKEV